MTINVSISRMNFRQMGVVNMYSCNCLDMIILNDYLKNVTGSEKTAHFAQDFKFELLVLKGRVALKQ